MRSTKMKFLLMIMAVTLCSSLAVAVSSGTITGSVMDSEGAIIKNAHLVFHRDFSGQNKPAAYPDVTRETDASGRFSVQLEPGFYDVCIMATAFAPECRKVLVTSGETREHNAQLKVDALIVQHLGDTF